MQSCSHAHSLLFSKHTTVHDMAELLTLKINNAINNLICECIWYIPTERVYNVITYIYVYALYTYRVHFKKARIDGSIVIPEAEFMNVQFC